MKKKRNYHLCAYVENSSPKLKKFHTLRSLKAFIENFDPQRKGHSGGYWIDYTVQNVTGMLSLYDETVDFVGGE